MKKQIQKYMKEIQAVLEADEPGTNWQEAARLHLIKIQFYQHERLIHLIVTVLFALLEVICLATMVATGNLGALALTLMILVLLIPYVGHYYFLENSVQELYLIYDEILGRASGQSAAAQSVAGNHVATRSVAGKGAAGQSERG